MYNPIIIAPGGQGFQFSIGDADPDMRIAVDVVDMLFQFSIGDARR